MIPIAIELFPCSGGMAEGFRRAGITFQWAFDYSKVACDSYEKNLGHRPVHMDVHDLVRLVSDGWRPVQHLDLLVADPPCTPWSRAGKRRGIDDPRDMLQATVQLIRMLRPRAYLIGNVPGLDDARSWSIVQRTIGGLAKEGYCANDFLTLDAADYGVPQHRVRPFWFGHLDGPCLTPPQRTHGNPVELGTLTIPGVDALQPWVTCRQALAHLDPKDLGRPVKLRYRGCNSHQHGSVPDKPARVVGTSNLSDGNVLLPGFGEPAPRSERAARHPGTKPRASELDAPAGVVTTRENGDGNVLTHGAPPAPKRRPRTADHGIVTSHQQNHRLRGPDRPAATITKNTHSDGALLVLDEGVTELIARRPDEGHAPHEADAPARTIRAGSRGTDALIMDPEHMDEPGRVVSSARGPASVLVANPKHPVSELDQPSRTVTTRDRGGQGATILANPKHPVLTEDAPSTTIRGGGDGHSAPQVVLEISDENVRWRRPSAQDEPARAVTAGDGTNGNKMLEWPWTKPSTTVTTRAGLPPPGHHPESGSILTMPGAVVLSEIAAKILQGFPESWVFAGKTKRERWEMLGMAMPPALAHAVARSICKARGWNSKGNDDGE